MKFAIALAVLLGVGSAPALAGNFYLNTEANSSFTGSDYTSTNTDLHIGYEGGNDTATYYIQGGPTISATDGASDNNTDLSGKLGGTFNVSQNIGVYGEVSTITNGDEDRNYGTKLGAKFSF